MNKERLEKLSDFELNKKILEVEAKKCGVAISNIRQHRSASKLECFSRAVFFDVDDGNKALKVDYCNNWADMGPLIAESRVNIKFDGVGCGAGAYPDEYNATIIRNANPLRAAAIVYLLMQEAKNASK